MKFAAARALAGTIAATGAKIGGYGANEMVEGLDRLAVAEAAAQRSEDLAAAGVGYAVAGIVSWRSPRRPAKPPGAWPSKASPRWPPARSSWVKAPPWKR